MKFYKTPEILAQVRTVNQDGEDSHLGDKVLGVQVLFDDDRHREGTAQLDLRGYARKGNENLIVEVPLSDLMAALTTAALNRDDDSKK